MPKHIKFHIHHFRLKEINWWHTLFSLSFLGFSPFNLLLNTTTSNYCIAFALPCYVCVFFSRILSSLLNVYFHRLCIFFAFFSLLLATIPMPDASLFFFLHSDSTSLVSFHSSSSFSADSHFFFASLHHPPLSTQNGEYIGVLTYHHINISFVVVAGSQFTSSFN